MNKFLNLFSIASCLLFSFILDISKLKLEPYKLCLLFFLNLYLFFDSFIKSVISNFSKFFISCLISSALEPVICLDISEFTFFKDFICKSFLLISIFFLLNVPKYLMKIEMKNFFFVLLIFYFFLFLSLLLI